MPVELPYRPPCRVPSVYQWAPGLRLTDATSAGVGRSRISGQTDGNKVDRRREDGVQLIGRAVLWLHVTLYRLTNGRLGGRFIAGTPILLLTTTGRRTGKRRTRPLAYVRDGERYVLCASNGGSPTHPGWYHNLTGDRPGPDPGRRRAPFCQRQDRRPSRARPAVSPVRGDVQGLCRLRGQDQPPDPAGAADPGQAELNRLKPWRRPLPCERKHRHLVTSGDAARGPLTLAYGVVVCRMLPAGCRVFAACSPPAQ
jgi:hypothetical protein